jgi:hypothetical protein
VPDAALKTGSDAGDTLRLTAVAVAAAFVLPGLGGGAAVSATSDPYPDASRTSTGLVPLIDLGAGTYNGYAGGLYPGGSNVPPPSYEEDGLAAAGRVTPRNSRGLPAANGRIVLLSIGMSNAMLEFATFASVVRADNGVSRAVALVNGAASGQTANLIADPAAPYWASVGAKLTAARLSPAQVQIVWLKDANNQHPDGFPEDALALEDNLAAILSILTGRFPNLQLVYLSSRTYGGYAETDLNPEPHAYDSGFAVKWLMEQRITDPPARPWLGWGPYLWTDGINGRSDGLVWTPQDVQQDGTHPSASGRQKVASLLLAFLKDDPTTTPWFTRFGLHARSDVPAGQ